MPSTVSLCHGLNASLLPPVDIVRDTLSDPARALKLDPRNMAPGLEHRWKLWQNFLELRGQAEEEEEEEKQRQEQSRAQTKNARAHSLCSCDRPLFPALVAYDFACVGTQGLSLPSIVAPLLNTQATWVIRQWPAITDLCTNRCSFLSPREVCLFSQWGCGYGDPFCLPRQAYLFL